MGGMDENPKLRRRYSLKAACVVMLAFSVGFGLLRANLAIGILYSIFALGGLVAYVIGRDPKEGIFWAMMAFIGLGCAISVIGGRI
jgi:hypothetical protein